MSEPYLSFVVTTRNDNHGGDQGRRIQIFLNSLFYLLRKHQLPAELVIVEWNPPSDRHGIRDALSWEKKGKETAVRIVRVSNETHRRLPNAELMPIFEYIGKNCGVRRARGGDSCG